MSEQRDIRIEKLGGLIEKGADPYRSDPGLSDRITQMNIIGAAVAEESFEDNTQHFTTAGRITAMRGHGKTAFFDLRDSTGKIQGYIKKDTVGEETMEIFKLLDVGDFVSISGPLFKTRTGEPTVMTEELQVLSKAIQPLPEKWHGLQDVEIRYRQRYLDLIANQESRDIFKNRSLIIRVIRKTLEDKGFIEVETPMMQSIPGGAAAKPFKTHHNALDMELYLRIAPELFLKRLLVGGMDRVYEINRNFRNEGISTKHNPEFTMIEVYQAYADYNVMMDLAEEIISNAAAEACPEGSIEFGDMTINFKTPWKRVPFNELMKEKCGITDIHDSAALEEYAKANHIDIKGKQGMQVVDEIFSEKIEPELVDPVFVTDYPVEMCPLSKRRKDDPSISERFELFIGGFEIANAYSELNDPVEQETRFREQAGTGAEGFDGVIDTDFVEALEYGMPPAGGLGIGIDRLVMILLGLTSIRDVILFPLLRKSDKKNKHEDGETGGDGDTAEE